MNDTTTQIMGTTPKVCKTVRCYPVDEDGIPMPTNLTQTPETDANYWNAAGLALVVDLFNWREVMTDEQMDDKGRDRVLELLEQAATTRQTASSEGPDQNKSGVAWALTCAMAALVAHCLDSKEAKEFMRQELRDELARADFIENRDAARSKSLALRVLGTEAA